MSYATVQRTGFESVLCDRAFAQVLESQMVEPEGFNNLTSIISGSVPYAYGRDTQN